MGVAAWKAAEGVTAPLAWLWCRARVAVAIRAAYMSSGPWLGALVAVAMRAAYMSSGPSRWSPPWPGAGVLTGVPCLDAAIMVSRRRASLLALLLTSCWATILQEEEKMGMEEEEVE